MVWGKKKESENCAPPFDLNGLLDVVLLLIGHGHPLRDLLLGRVPADQLGLLVHRDLISVLAPDVKGKNIGFYTRVLFLFTRQ